MLLWQIRDYYVFQLVILTILGRGSCPYLYSVTYKVFDQELTFVGFSHRIFPALDLMYTLMINAVGILIGTYVLE